MVLYRATGRAFTDMVARSVIMDGAGMADIFTIMAITAVIIIHGLVLIAGFCHTDTTCFTGATTPII